MTFILWCILFVLCWPVALLALVLYPFVWLLLLPFRVLWALQWAECWTCCAPSSRYQRALSGAAIALSR